MFVIYNNFYFYYIISQQKILNDLDSSIKENQNKLLSINTINFKSPLLAKYVLDNNMNSKILTQEQINEILVNDKNRNEDELKQILREIENGRVISFAPVFISLLLTAIYCIITKIIQKSKKVEFKQDLL